MAGNPMLNMVPYLLGEGVTGLVQGYGQGVQDYKNDATQRFKTGLDLMDSGMAQQAYTDMQREDPFTGALKGLFGVKETGPDKKTLDAIDDYVNNQRLANYGKSSGVSMDNLRIAHPASGGVKPSTLGGQAIPLDSSLSGLVGGASSSNSSTSVGSPAGQSGVSTSPTAPAIPQIPKAPSSVPNTRFHPPMVVMSTRPSSPPVTTPVAMPQQAQGTPATQPSIPSAITVLPGNNSGLLHPGNINLNSIPVIKGKDGEISTGKFYAKDLGPNEGVVVLPLFDNEGKNVKTEDAILHYAKTGQNLGLFATEEAADAYIERLHQNQATRFGQPGGPATTDQTSKPASLPIPAGSAAPTPAVASSADRTTQSLPAAAPNASAPASGSQPPPPPQVATDDWIAVPGTSFEERPLSQFEVSTANGILKQAGLPELTKAQLNDLGTINLVRSQILPSFGSSSLLKEQSLEMQIPSASQTQGAVDSIKASKLPADLKTVYIASIDAAPTLKSLGDILQKAAAEEVTIAKNNQSASTASGNLAERRKHDRALESEAIGRLVDSSDYHRATTAVKAAQLGETHRYHVALEGIRRGGNQLSALRGEESTLTQRRLGVSRKVSSYQSVYDHTKDKSSKEATDALIQIASASAQMGAIDDALADLQDRMKKSGGTVPTPPAVPEPAKTPAGGAPQLFNPAF